MSRKRIYALITAVLMITVVFAGCKKDDGAKSGGDSTQNPKSDGAKIKLKLGIYPEDTDQAAIDAHKTFMANYAVTRPDVEVVPSYYKYATDNFIPMAEAGTVPTIFESWYTEPQKLIKSGYVRDITQILKDKGWYDEINPSIRDLLSKDGKIYGIPRDGYALGLMINIELFEEAGLMNGDVPKYPKTWEELAQTAKTIKDKTGSAGFVLLAQDGAGGWHWSNIAWAFGANLVKDNGDGTFTSQLNSAEAIAAMEYVKSLKWEYDVLTADPTSENWGTGFTQLGTGAAAMYIGANDAVAQPTSQNGLAVDKLALVPLPAGPGGQYSLSGGTPYMFAANATDEEVIAALDYLIVMGKAPELTTDARIGLEEDAKYRKENGIPVISRFPCWNNPELSKAEEEANAKYANVNPALFADYYAATLKDGNLRMEEPGLTQDMYSEITKVLQEVVTNPNADVTALMNTANGNYQKLLNDAGIGK